MAPPPFRQFGANGSRSCFANRDDTGSSGSLGTLPYTVSRGPTGLGWFSVRQRISSGVPGRGGR